MKIILSLIIFVFGISVGSFLNCVIYRLEIKRSFLKGRSFCPKCHHILRWYDLIPILSFIFLKGKCRYCREKISFQYPLVEIATGILFLSIFWHLNSGRQPDLRPFFLVDLLYLLIVSCLLVIIFVYDLKHYIIPDKIIYPAIGITFVFRILDFGHWDLLRIWDLGSGILRSLQTPLIAGVSAGAFFFLLWLVSGGRWMGLGDAKLAFFMGLFLGFPNIVVGIFSAFFLGAIIGLGLIAFGKKSLKSKIPFGPFLVTGTFIALFFGEKIINCYLNLM
ncbi:MAG: prepilin peptidase [Candidatus Nealsonbacteria bacterium]|nr:MAG: prepilin peptidase [Candidatus Nealsonbacteria bacterium]